MGLIQIEWVSGKPPFWQFSKNFSKLRRKSKIPYASDIDFNKSVYPFLIYLVLIPMLLFMVFRKYSESDLYIFLIVINLTLLVLGTFIGIVYLIYRVIIDTIVFIKCFIKSFVLTIFDSVKRVH